MAALCVALNHSLGVYGGILDGGSLGYLLGRVPVLFFFILSGFVLSRSLAGEYPPGISECLGYWSKRCFRLYPAVFLSLLIAYACSRLFGVGLSVRGVDPGFLEALQRSQGVNGLREIAGEFLLRHLNLDHPLWTIRVEFFSSFLLPILMLLSFRFTKFIIPLLLAFSLLLFRGSSSNIYGAFYFLFPFYLGFLIQYFSPVLEGLSPRISRGILLGLFLFLTIPVCQGLNDVTGSLILGGILAVFVPCHLPIIKAFLLSKPLLFLGRISFSFYLLHLPFLMLCFSIASRFQSFHVSGLNALPASMVLFACSVCITVPASFLVKIYIEDPFNTVGHRLSWRIAAAFSFR